MTKGLAWGFILAAIFGAFVVVYDAGARGERKKNLAAEATATVKRFVDTVRVRDVVYQKDTVRLWRTLERYDTTRVTDTLVVTRHDTAVVYIPRAVADEAVEMCRITVGSCEARVAARDSVIAAQDERAERLADLIPSSTWTWTVRAFWAIVGYFAGKGSR